MKVTHALALLALLSAGAAVQAQTPPPGRTFGDGSLPEFLKPYDANNDGVLSAEEREAARKDRIARREEALAKWDTDGDGKLSPEEIAAARKAACDRINQIREQRFDDADTDDDGYLSAEEFAAMVPPEIPDDMVDRIFNHLDADDDNQIAKAEFLRACEPPPPPPPPPPIPGFETADVNPTDGQVSPEEFVTALTAAGFTAEQARHLFARHDADHNGTLSPTEYPGAKPPPPPPPVLPPFDVADADDNGTVSKPEFMRAANAAGIPGPVAEDMFRRADRDRNWVLGPLEYGSLLPPPPPPAP